MWLRYPFFCGMMPRDSIILSRRFEIIILSQNVGIPSSNDATSHARITYTSRLSLADDG